MSTSLTPVAWQPRTFRVRRYDLISRVPGHYSMRQGYSRSRNNRHTDRVTVSGLTAR